jgi:hypothetical protein
VIESLQAGVAAAGVPRDVDELAWTEVARLLAGVAHHWPNRCTLKSEHGVPRSI